MSNTPYPIFSDPRSINEKADAALVKGLTSHFPIENKHYQLQLSDVHVDRKEYDQKDEKDAILRSKSLTYPIKGTLSLLHKATGAIVDKEKDFPLMDSFF